MTERLSSSSSFSNQWPYDVFLNFRGEDTRHGFVGHLFNALRRNGIHTFMDDGELRKGDEIAPSLLKAIEESRMAITIFSKNYASSTFCLDELDKILRCIKGNGRLVLPIFYDVEPSDVRYQKGRYKKALAMHQKNFKANEETVRNWKLALRQAANLSGLHFNPRHEYEIQFIEKIVNEISSKINRTSLPIARYPIGLESRVLEINHLLGVGSTDEVIVLGICGIGGMGKTTIARAVYNSIANHFEGLCFLHDIKENSRKVGLEQMQEKMLSMTLGVDIKVKDVNNGVPIIKRRLYHKKILLILDNVDKQEQLEYLIGNCDWFGSGSKIIITTRDKQLLTRLGVKRLYEMKEFNNDESLEFLSWNAFKTNQVDPSYDEVLNCVVQYAKGLPLALELIGSHLFDKSIEEWKSAIEIYRRIPNEEVQKILKISYDDLGEVEKEIFLDIASFFKGASMEYVKDMLQHAYGFNPSNGIRVLMNKCLINYDYGYVEMHDLIQDMGREVVRQESPNEVGKRSRLWNNEDIAHVLENNMGTDKIKVIIQTSLSEDIEVNWDGEAFKKMKSLVILIIWNAHFSKGPSYLPNSLRVLKWLGCPSISLPNDFCPRKLAILELRESCLRSLVLIKRLENLTVLNLSSCQFITWIPDLSGFPNLTKLLLESCENLVEIHDSVGYLEKLETLSATYCTKLKNVPLAFKLRYLKYLGLKGCSSLENFPEILEKMQYITKLDLSFTNLELPFSIENLIGLEELFIHGCKRIQLPSSIGMLPKVQTISIQGCGELQSSKQDKGQEVNSMGYSNLQPVFHASNIFDEFLPISFKFFANLHSLDLSYNNLTILPAWIKECYHLLYLYLNDCKHLKEIRGIPPNIKRLRARNCTLLSSESTRILLSQELHEAGDKRFIVPGASIPEWFDHNSIGPSISFWFRNNFPIISLCFVVTPSKDMGPPLQSLLANVIINGKDVLRASVWDLSDCSSILADHILCVYAIKWRIFRHMNELLVKSEWNHVEFRMSTKLHGLQQEKEDKLICVKEIGMNLMKQESRREDVQFIDPYKRKQLDGLNYDSSFGVSSWYKGPSNPLPSHVSHLIGRDTKNGKEDNKEGINDSENELIWYYEMLWKLQLPGEIKFFLWKALQNRLAVKENMPAKEINMDDHTCPNCGTVGESIMHTLVACPFAEVIWSMSPLMLRSQSLPQASFSSWWEGLSSSLSYLQDSTGMLEIAGFICWRIWKYRNEKVFKRGSMGARQVISLVMQQINKFQASLQGPQVLSSDFEEKDINNSECLPLPSCWKTPLVDENRTSFSLVSASDTSSSNQGNHQKVEGGIHAFGSINTEFDSYWKRCVEDELKKKNANPSSSCGVVSSPPNPIKLSEVPHARKWKARRSVVVAGSDDKSILLNSEKMLQMQPELFFQRATDLQQLQNLTSISQEIPKNFISQQVSKSSENIRIAERKNEVVCRDNPDKEKHIDALEDPMKWEYQLAYKKGQHVANDQSTKRDKRRGAMISQQRRYRWHLCLRVLISLVVLCPYVLLLWLLHDFLATRDNEMAPPT